MVIKIGIIGGSGLNNPTLFQEPIEKQISTEYGEPSDVLICGKIEGIDCVLLARHSRSHSVPPSSINFRANICALKKEGCTHILTTTACGSLQENIQPGNFVVLDQFIDRTNSRKLTFFDGLPGSWNGVCHLPMAQPFCEGIRQAFIEACQKVGVKTHKSGTVVTIEGPRFSTLAESKLFRSWNCDVINMTTVPEVTLAREAGILYGSLAMATDYDCWKQDHGSVNVQDVLAVFKENSKKAINVLTEAIKIIASKNWEKEIEDLNALVKNSTIA